MTDGLFLRTVILHVSLLICRFPSLSFRAAGVKTEMPFIAEAFCSKVSDLELSILESSEREGEIGDFGSIC